MRDRFPMLMVGFIALLGVFALFLMKGAARGSFADKLSTYRSEPDGSRALWLLAEQSKLGVTRWQHSFEVVSDLGEPVLLAVEFDEDTRELSGSPFAAALDGGFNFSPQPDDDEEDDEDAKLHHGMNNVLATAVQKDEREKLLEHVKAGHTLVYVPWGATQNPLLKAIDVTLWKAEKQLDVRTLVPPQPTPWTAGVERVETRVQSYLRLPSGATPLLVDEHFDAPVAARVPYGQGAVIVIGAPELAMNRTLAKGDNARFWLSLFAALRGEGQVMVDEFHHGFTGERSVAEFAARYGLQFAVLQLVFGVALWAASLRRFGRPRSPKEDQRFGSTDALFATSRLYREGRHHAHAASLISKELAGRFAPIAGTSSKAEPTDVCTALRLKGRPELAAALEQVALVAGSVSSEAQLLALASTAAKARALLSIRGNRQRSSSQPRI
ncbi:MAG: hypothetical protein QM723_13480 [Myxococcaceae bacterium]